MRSIREETGQSRSRREVLAGFAGLSAGVAAGPVGAAHAGGQRRARDAGTTVATWNCYLGVDLFRLFDADSPADLRSVSGELLAAARRHPHAARADAIADSLLVADADVVALQEAPLVRSRPLFDEDAEAERVVDLLALVTAALDEREASYEVATTQVTTDVTVPAEVDDQWVTVRLTDRVALLVDEGVDVRDTRSGRYDARARFAVLGDDLVVTLRRGYCTGDLAVEGEPLTACSTHLESANADVRRRQAAELLDTLPDAGTVVVAADLNSGPSRNSAAYETLTESLTDAAAAVSDSPGDTCCQPAGLRNERSRLDSRVDHVLSRGGPAPTAVERLGVDPTDRVDATVDGESVTVWPSDHAGVAATYPVPEPTPSPTPTSSSAPTDTPTDELTAPAAPTATTDGTGDGFGVLAAVTALLGAGVARRRD